MGSPRSAQNPFPKINEKTAFLYLNATLRKRDVEMFAEEGHQVKGASHRVGNGIPNSLSDPDGYIASSRSSLVGFTEEFRPSERRVF
jgi:hypothetical protein